MSHRRAPGAARARSFRRFRRKVLLFLLLCCLASTGFNVSIMVKRPSERALNHDQFKANPTIALVTMLRISHSDPGAELNSRSGNALRSFLALRGVSEVFVVVDHEEECSTLSSVTSAGQLSCFTIPHECVHSTVHKPTMGCIFRQIRSLVHADVFVFVNGDIILFDSLISAIHTIDRDLSEYVMVGRRWDVTYAVSKLIENKSNRAALELRTRATGKLHGDYGLDYFVMKREHIPVDLPEFVSGAWKWDNTLLSIFMIRGIPVVDGTAVVTALHQGLNSRTYANHTTRIGSLINSRLAFAAVRNAYIVGRSDAADYKLRIFDGQIQLLNASYHPRHSLHKCLLQKISLHDRLFVFFVGLDDLSKYAENEWRLQAQRMRELNHVLIINHDEYLDFLTGIGLNACYASDPMGKYSFENIPSAETLLQIAYLGVDILLVFKFWQAHLYSQHLTTMSNGNVSLGIYDDSMVVYISGELGKHYLSKAVWCQTKALAHSRIHTLMVFFGRRNLLAEKYLGCLKSVP